MSVRHKIAAAMFGLSFAFSTPVVYAQTTGGVRGVISDFRTGRVISRARVIVDSPAVGRITRLTDEHGFFAFLSLPPGRVTVIVEKDGYNVVDGPVCISAGLYRSTTIHLARSGGLQTLFGLNRYFRSQSDGPPRDLTADVYSFDDC